MSDGFKTLVPHDAEVCWYVDPARDADDRGRVFICQDGHEFGRRKNGAAGGSTMWHRFRCNCPACPAVVIVRWDTMVDFVEGGGLVCE